MIYHPNGSLYKQGYFENGVFHGNNCLDYGDAGNVLYVGSYNNGIREGFGVEFNNEGYKIKKGTMKNNKLNGDNCKVYHNYGNLQYIGQMNCGKFDGLGKLYHSNGVLNYEGLFLNDMPHGENCIIYSKKNGNIKYVGDVKEGKFHGKGAVFDHGLEKPVMIGFFYNGVFVEGEKTCSNETGIISYKGGWKNNNYNNRGVLYHPNGKVLYQGYFYEGKEENQESVIYNALGEICFLGSLKKGKVIGYSENFGFQSKEIQYYGDDYKIEKEHSKSSSYYDDPRNNGVCSFQSFENDKYCKIM